VNKSLEVKPPADAAKKARDGRNIALAVGLVAFVILVFVVTLVRLGGSVAHHA
jgi:hypothetical protein